MRDALSLFDQVLAFTGDAVKDDEVAGLLGLVDRELLHRATRAIVDGSSLAMLELVESLADYGADYRNFVRELLLHLREVLLVKLAPPGSPLLAQVLPEEAQELRALADALSEEDLLRGLDLLTRAEGELRSVTDPRVALDLVLLKLVQMRRLVPFAEVVARVERLVGGALPEPRRTPSPPAAPRSAPAPALPCPRPPPPLSGRAWPRARPRATNRRPRPRRGRPRRSWRQCSANARPGRRSLRRCARPPRAGGRDARARSSSRLPDVREGARRGLPGLRRARRPVARWRSGSIPTRRDAARRWSRPRPRT